MQNFLTTLKTTKIIPLLSLQTIEHARQMTQLLVESNILLLEIQFNGEASLEIIKVLKKEFPQVTILVGGVITESIVLQVTIAGADIITTPSINHSIIQLCKNHNKMIIPSINTPLSIEMTMENDISLVNYFPAEASGGTKLIKFLNPVYPNMIYIPRGGIDDSNIDEYFVFKNVIACATGFISETKQIQKGNWRLLKTRIKTIQSILKYT